MCLCLSGSRLVLNMLIPCCAMHGLTQSSLSLLPGHTHRSSFSLEEKLQGNGDAAPYSNSWSAHGRQNCNQRSGQMSLGSPYYLDFFFFFFPFSVKSAVSIRVVSSCIFAVF